METVFNSSLHYKIYLQTDDFIEIFICLLLYYDLELIFKLPYYLQADFRIFLANNRMTEVSTVRHTCKLKAGYTHLKNSINIQNLSWNPHSHNVLTNEVF